VSIAAIACCAPGAVEAASRTAGLGATVFGQAQHGKIVLTHPGKFGAERRHRRGFGPDNVSHNQTPADPLQPQDD